MSRAERMPTRPVACGSATARFGSVARPVSAARTIAPPRRSARPAVTPWAPLVAGCVAAAALSLLIASQTTYDPTAWLIWGREIIHGELSTTAGPSWKPLPVAVTVPAALLGDAAQQDIWLVAARAGALVAIVLAYRVAHRLAGPVAGTIAAAALLIAEGFASRAFRGTSEGLLAAFGLGAVEAHLAGRRGIAFALVAGTALIRPELCAAVALYGLWLASTHPAAALRTRWLAITAGACALIVAAWLVPEKIGSGELFRAASRALYPVPGSPAQSSYPFIATFANAAPVLAWPLYAAGVALVVVAARRRTADGRIVLALAALATALMVTVALMAQGGFTGSTRYLTIPIALTCVIGAAGCVRLAAAARGRLSPRAATAAIAVATLAAAPFFVHDAVRTADEMSSGLAEAAAYDALPGTIDRAGGRAAVLRCGMPYTDPFDTQAVARALRVHEIDVGIRPRAPGTIVARRGSALTADRRFAVVAQDSRWVIASSCAR